jgi:DNA polymerase III alpha subunit
LANDELVKLLIKDIIKYAKDANEIPSLTDHGTIGGAIEFINKCNEEKIIPAIGCEFYLNNHIKRLQELRTLIDIEKDFGEFGREINSYMNRNILVEELKEKIKEEKQKLGID